MRHARVHGLKAAQNIFRQVATVAREGRASAQSFLDSTTALRGSMGREVQEPDWQQLDAQALITRNPAFWELYYETKPGDAGVMLLQAGVLQAAGDVARSQYVMLLAGMQPGGTLDPAASRALEQLRGAGDAFRTEAKLLLEEAWHFRERRDYPSAMTIYEGILRQWPGLGRVHGEIGVTRRILAGQRKELAPRDLDDNFERARWLEPLEEIGWQGQPGRIPGLVEMVGGAVPFWKSVASGRVEKDPRQWERFAGQLQNAQVDDLALLARQMVILRRGQLLPADTAFIGKCLRRLVPGPAAERTLTRLALPAADRPFIALWPVLDPEH